MPISAHNFVAAVIFKSAVHSLAAYSFWLWFVEKMHLEAVSSRMLSPLSSNYGVGVLAVPSLIRLRRTRISDREFVFLVPGFSSFAPFGAGILIHRTNLKNLPFTAP